MFANPIIFIDQPTSWRWDLIDRVREAGFRGFVVRTVEGDTIKPEVATQAVTFRDRARANGFACGQWVILEVDRSIDPTKAGELANDLAFHYDGTLVDAETTHSPDAVGLPFLAAFTSTKPLALSPVPTFPFGNGAAAWDRRGAWLLQQTYSMENGWTPQMAKTWALLSPPLNVGWYYRAVVNGRGRRIKLIGMTEFFYKADSIDGLLYVHKTTRNIRKTLSGKVIGKLAGLWNPTHWAPTLRTTPISGKFLSGTELSEQVLEAGRPPCGFYLGESTDESVWDNYRP